MAWFSNRLRQIMSVFVSSPSQKHDKRPRFDTTLSIRKLEGRRVLAVTPTYVGDILTLESDNGDNTIEIGVVGTDLVVTDEMGAQSFALATFNRLNIVDQGGNDTLTFQDSLTIAGTDGLSLRIEDIEQTTLEGTLLLGQGLTILNGAFSDTVTSQLTVTQFTNIQAGANDVDLDQGTVNLVGRVSITTTQDVSLKDTGILVLHNLDVGGNLDVTTTGTVIDTPTGIIHIAGQTSINASNAFLDNGLHNFEQEFSANVTNSLTVTDADDLLLDQVSVGDTLIVSIDGTLTDTNLSVVDVTGRSELSADTITLDSGLHKFTGQVHLASTNDTTLLVDDTLIIKETTIGGNLTAHTNGDLLDRPTGAIDVTGTSDISADNIVLDNGQHTFGGAVTVTSLVHTTLTDADSLELANASVGGAIAIDVVDDITQTPGTTMSVSTTTFLRGNDILLENTGNDFMGAVRVVAGNDLRLRDASNLLLADLNVTRDLTLTAGLGVFDLATAEIQVGRNSSIAATSTIRLADDSTNKLTVVGDAGFTTATSEIIDIGSGLAGGAEIRFGSLALEGGRVSVFETDDTHLSDVNVASLRISTANKITQVEGTSILVTNLLPLPSTLFQLRSGSGHVYLARGSSDPGGGTVNDGTVANNQLEGPVRISGQTIADLGVAATSNVHIRNESAVAEFPEFFGLPLMTPLELRNFELWFTENSIEFPSLAINVAEQLRVVAGLDGDLDNPTITAANATITDTIRAQINVSGSAEFFAAARIALADRHLPVPSDNHLYVTQTAKFVVARVAADDTLLDAGTIDVGVRPVNNADDLDRGDAGGEFRAGSVTFRAGTETNDHGHVTLREIDATRFTGNSIAGTLVMSSAGNITDAPGSQLIISDSVGNREYARFQAGVNDIILGRDGQLSFSHHGQASLDRYVSAIGNNISLTTDGNINLRRDVGDGVSQPVIRFRAENSLWINASNGTILQVGRANQGSLVAASAGMTARAILLHDTTFGRFGATVTSTDNVGLLAVQPARLPDATPDADDLRPYDLDANSYQPPTVPPPALAPTYEVANNVDIGRQTLSNNYGLVLVNRGQLTVGHVTDATDTSQSLVGIKSNVGHVYMETIERVGSDNKLKFDGTNGIMLPFTAVEVLGNGVFTALAASELEIAANTTLKTESGQVNSVGEFTTYDDRIMNNNANKVGVRMVLTPPDNVHTTRDLTDYQQDIQLQIGRQGESNLYVAVRWANQFSEWPGGNDTYEIRRYGETAVSPDGLEVDITKVFSPAELRLTPFGPYLPTTIRAFNDPSINLYDKGAAANIRDLNVATFSPPPVPISRFGMNAPAGAELTADGNYVLVNVGQIVASDPTPATQPARVILDSPPPPVVFLPPEASREIIEFDDVRPTIVVGADLVEYGKREGDMLTEPRATWDGAITDTYIADIMSEIEADNMMKWGPSGKFRIHIQLRNGLFRSIDLIKTDEGKVIIERTEAKLNVESNTTVSFNESSIEHITVLQRSSESSQLETSSDSSDTEWASAWSRWTPSTQGQFVRADLGDRVNEVTGPHFRADSLQFPHHQPTPTTN